MEEIHDDVAFDATFSIHGVTGARVLTPNGTVVGRIKSIQTDENVLKVKGLVVTRGISGKEWYIGREYVRSFTSESCILNEEPSLLLKGKSVISHEGERVGKVISVVRVDSTNKVRYLEVKRWFAEPLQIKPSHIASIGTSILLKEGVNVPKRSFWRNSA